MTDFVQINFSRMTNRLNDKDENMYISGSANLLSPVLPEVREAILNALRADAQKLLEECEFTWMGEEIVEDYLIFAQEACFR